MDRDKLMEEIRRVEDALNRTRSPKLKKDYGKHLKRLYQNLRYYDRSMERWQTKRTLSEVTKPIS